MTMDEAQADLEHNMNILREIAKVQGRNTARIQALNDALRIHGRGGIVVMTEGVAALGISTVNAVFRAVAAFDKFTRENDPWGEHDCAIVTVGGIEFIGKIDYYDRSRRIHSPDPADPRVTVRTLTVMRADEY